MLLLLIDLLPPFLGTIKSILDDVEVPVGTVGRMQKQKTSGLCFVFVVVEFVF